MAHPDRKEKDIPITELVHIWKHRNSFGYKLLSSRTAATIVPEIETECLEKGEVAIFHLLFSELLSVR